MALSSSETQTACIPFTRCVGTHSILPVFFHFPDSRDTMAKNRVCHQSDTICLSTHFMTSRSGSSVSKQAMSEIADFCEETLVFDPRASVPLEDAVDEFKKRNPDSLNHAEFPAYFSTILR